MFFQSGISLSLIHILIDHFTESGKVLVLDDFHYASDKIQYDIACQLKEVIRLGFKAIVISLPYRSDDAIRLNPDLTGRISIIEIEPWKQRELEEIARKGFCELGIELEARLIERMALESINSPQLMQSICLNIGLLPFDVEEITDEVSMESCRFTCNNFPYSDVVRVLKSCLLYTSLAEEGQELVIRKKTGIGETSDAWYTITICSTGKTFEATASLTEREGEIYAAGGLLSFIKGKS